MAPFLAGILVRCRKRKYVVPLGAARRKLDFLLAMPFNISKVLWSKCNFIFLAQLHANKLALCMTERGERSGNIFPYLLVYLM
jgi:hypothetical protein